MSPTQSTACSGGGGEINTHNVLPLLHEIRHALGQWLQGGEATVIDLRGIPMAPGEEEQLIARLGGGEIQARLSALGDSEIVETAYPGVWLVTHRNTDGEVIGRYIEVCEIPQILKAQQEDVRAGLQRLEAELGR
ncbi:MAG: hydrogenase expression/formation C-terminal domain-containing protein [Gammaproteobacteria bacterium]|jgi:hydrogenase-1 operon protein HyaF